MEWIKRMRSQRRSLVEKALWSQLFPAEQARIIQLLVRRVTVTAAGLEVDIRREGIAGVIREMMAPRRLVAAE